MSFPRCGRALRRQAVRTAEDEHRVLDRQAEQQHGQAVDAQTKAAVRQAAVPGDGGHHEEMDRTAAGLERDPRTAVDLLRRAHARVTPPYPDVKGKGCKQPGFAALDAFSAFCYWVIKGRFPALCRLCSARLVNEFAHNT